VAEPKKPNPIFTYEQQLALTVVGLLLLGAYLFNRAGLALPF
jgi:hypothetical protein